MRPTPPEFREGQPKPSNRPNDVPPPPPIAAQRPDSPLKSESPGFPSQSRSTMTSYSRSLRGTDVAVKNEFSNLNVWLPEGQTKNVPLIWGPQEKAVAIAISDAIDKSEVRIDRIKLPMVAVTAGDYAFASERFTYHQNIRWLKDGAGNFAYGAEKVYGDTIYGKSRGLPVDKNYTMIVWTRYMEDMNQLVEQILLKFSPIITLEVEGVHWEVVLKLDGVSNSVSSDIGDAAIRIIKHEFSFHAETYISRGIIRGKTVMDIYNEIGTGSGDELGETMEIHATEEDIEKLKAENSSDPAGANLDLNSGERSI